MEIVVERVAGLDVHKASVTACVRVSAPDGERVEEVQTLPTTVPGLLALADWLETHAVTPMAMEATGVYWKPAWAILEDRFGCILVLQRLQGGRCASSGSLRAAVLAGTNRDGRHLRVPTFPHSASQREHEQQTGPLNDAAQTGGYGDSLPGRDEYLDTSFSWGTPRNRFRYHYRHREAKRTADFRAQGHVVKPNTQAQDGRIDPSSRVNGSAPTMREVARLAGVSSATVSRVLSGSTRVRGEHRRQVLETVERVGYRPNMLARNLRRQRAETIGVLVPDIENPHFSESVRVFEDAAFRVGYRLLLHNTDEAVDKQRVYVEALADERVLGVIAAPADAVGAGLEPLFELDIPVVAFDRAIADARADAVLCDNPGATRQATEHLIWLGHQRIAYVGGRPDVVTGAKRLEGYTGAMRAAKLTPFSVNGDFRAALAQREVTALLALQHQPTAFVVANNLMAIGVLRAIRRTGLAIPGDVALVAIDDPPWAELIDPPLTVVAQPTRQMAETAIALLLQRIRQPRDEGRQIVLPTDLRIRSSCGMRQTTSKEGAHT